MRRRGVRVCTTLAALAVAAGYLISVPSSARAQLVPIPRLKAGIFVPSSSELADITGDVWLKIGADVDLPMGVRMLGFSTRLGAEYAVRSGDHILPLTLSVVWQPGLATLSSPVYVGAGIGLWFMNVADESTTRFGVRLFAGVNLGTNTFAELQYDRVRASGDVDADGFSGMIGFRF